KRLSVFGYRLVIQALISPEVCKHRLRFGQRRPATSQCRLNVALGFLEILHGYQTPGHCDLAFGEHGSERQRLLILGDRISISALVAQLVSLLKMKGRFVSGGFLTNLQYPAGPTDNGDSAVPVRVSRGPDAR